MASEKKKKTSNNGIPAELKELTGEIAKFKAGDKEPVVRIGTKLEKVWTTLKVGEADKAVTNLLKKCLATLQAFYQDKLDDASTVWQLIGQATEAVENALAGAQDGPDQVASVMEALKKLAKSSEKKKKDPAPAKKAPAQTDIDNVLGAIEGIAAKLMGYAPTDQKELASLGDELLKIVSCPSVSSGAVGHLTVAAQLIETVIQGKTDNLEDTLAQTTKALGVAADVQETSQEQQAEEESTSQPRAAVPQAEKSIPETPTEEPQPQPQAATQAEEIEFPDPAIMAEDTDAELLNEYIIESSDHITAAEGALLGLESNPQDREQIDVVFRAYHTIKGTSGFLGFDRIQKCAHLAENLLDRAREGEIKIKGGYADLCLRSCDCLRTMLEGLQGLQSGDELPIPDDLGELLKILSAPEAAGYGEELDDVEPMRIGDILVGKSEAPRRTVEKADKVKGDKKLGEKLIEDKTVKPEQVVDAIRTQNQIKQAKGVAAEGTIRVGTSRLDNLINVVGELVIAQSMVAADPDVALGAKARLQRNVGHAGKIIRELQDLTMLLRMVPLKGVFQKMNRLVRDLARKSGKQVVFKTEGEETEIDRNMVESINDPLVHMIRNSVDHGVESPEARIAAGKDPTGTVTLRAYHAAGNIVIELEDDGKGLDHDVILNKAIEKGVVKKGRDMTENEVFMLIFAPGFSTAEKVTDVSGRGVGMDVVKRNVDSLRGRIDVASKAGQGSTFSVRLPLTMAIVDAMVLRVGQERYLLPTVSIEQSFQPEEGTISTVTGTGEMVMLRGELLPLFRLHEIFNIETAETDPYKALLVVVEGDGRRCALMVDELLGQQQVVVKSLGQGMAKVPGISGGAILENGNVGLILDATELLQLAEGRGSEIAVSEEAMAF